MHEAGNRCNELLEKTANALNDKVVNLMLLAVKTGNLELSIKIAVTKSVFSLQNRWKKPQFYFRACGLFRGGEKERGEIIGKCVAAFPYMWFYVSAAVCLSCLLSVECFFSPGCEYCPSFILFSAYWPLSNLLSRMWVPSFVLLNQYLLTSLAPSLLTRMWVPPIVFPVHCLLTSLSMCLHSPGCEYCPLFVPSAVLTSLFFSAC